MGEIIDVGAFRFSVRAAKDPNGTADIVALAAHDATAPLARVRAGTLDVEETAAGLEFEATIAETTAGNDILELIRSATSSGVSFGFRLPATRNSPNALEIMREPFQLGDVRFDPEPDVPPADVRVVRDLILSEISLGVAFPVFRDNQAELRARSDQPPKRRKKLWVA